VNINKKTLPTQIEKDGLHFQATDMGSLNVAHFNFPKGTNATPLLEGMPDNLCQVPHWGYVLKGSIHIRYKDGREETAKAGDVYHWPAGHTIWTDEDYESVEFSPKEQMNELIAHLKTKIK
jgi:hypothetical protein